MKKILLAGSALVAVSFSTVGAVHATELNNPTHPTITLADPSGLVETTGTTAVTIDSTPLGAGLTLGANATPSVVMNSVGNTLTITATASGAHNGVVFADNVTAAAGNIVINATNDNLFFYGDVSNNVAINSGSAGADGTTTITINTMNAENITFAGTINAVDAGDTVNLGIYNNVGGARTIDITGAIGGGSNAERIDNIQIGAATNNNLDVRFQNNVNAQGNITLGAVGGTNTNLVTFGLSGQTRGYTGTIVGAEAGDTNNVVIASGSNTSFNSAFGANLDNITVGGAGVTTAAFHGDIAAVSGAFTLAGAGGVLNNVTFDATGRGGTPLVVSSAVTGADAAATNNIFINGGANQIVTFAETATNIDLFTIASGTTFRYQGTAINNVVGQGGNLTLDRAGNQDVTTDIASSGQKLSVLTLGGSGTKSLQNAVYADTTNIANVTVDAAASIAGNIVFQNGGRLNFAHNAGTTGSITTDTNGMGEVHFAGASAVDGAIGASGMRLGTLSIDSNDNTRNVTLNGQVHANNLNLTNVGGVVFSNSSNGSTLTTVTKTNAGTALLNNQGTVLTINAIAVNAGTLDVNGVVTAGDATLANGTTLEFEGATLGAVTGGGGNLTLNGGATQTVGALGAAGGGNALGTVNLSGLGDKVLSGAVYAGTVHMDDFTVTAQNATLNTNMNFKANNTLNLANATTITGNVTNDTAGHGTMNYTGGLNITGNLAQLNTFNLNSAVAVGGNATAANNMDIGIQNMTVGGTFTTTNNTQLTYRVNTPTTSGKITATGEATVVAGTKVNMVVDTNVYVAQGQEFVLIDGAESGGHVATLTAGNLTTTNTALLHFKQKTTDTNNLIVYADRTQMNVAAKDPNAGAVGAMLDKHGFFADPDVNDLQVRLGKEMTAQGVEDILKTLHTDPTGAATNSIVSVGNTTSTITSGRVDSVRAGDTGNSGVSSGDGDVDKHVWLQAFGATVDQGRRDGVAGYDADSYGMIAGIDTNVSDDLLLGIALAYGNTEANSADANRTDTDMDSYQISLYADHDLGDKFFLTGQLSYMYSDIDTVRRNVGGIAGNTARANFGADQYGARAELGRPIDVGSGISLTPSGLVNYSYVDIEDYTERGAGGLSLRNVDTDEMQVLEFGVNLKAEAALQDGAGGTFKPNIHGGVRHDVVGDDVATSAFLAGGGAAFKTQGFDAAQTTGNIGAGLKWETAAGFDFSANYDYEYKSDYDAHSGYVRAGYRF